MSKTIYFKRTVTQEAPVVKFKTSPESRFTYGPDPELQATHGVGTYELEIVAKGEMPANPEELNAFVGFTPVGATYAFVISGGIPLTFQRGAGFSQASTRLVITFGEPGTIVLEWGPMPGFESSGAAVLNSAMLLMRKLKQ